MFLSYLSLVIIKTGHFAQFMCSTMHKSPAGCLRRCLQITF